jgi:hypothetical protein
MRHFLLALASITLFASPLHAQPQEAGHAPPPVPLISEGHPAEWIFVYKMNASAFPSSPSDPGRACPFGGSPRPGRLSHQYVFATDANPVLQMGPGLLGTSASDPIGATFAEIFNGRYSYVVWNDQFQTFPMRDRAVPWGHSKGILAWNEEGEGLVLQVTTPAWPGSGSAAVPRIGEGNTLGCLTRARNNMTNAQHFFALRLSPQDVETVLTALENASVVTDVNDPTHQIASIGGPDQIQLLARRLGVQSTRNTVTNAMLSSGVRLISKPSLLHVPPWQLVSAILSPPSTTTGPALRTATWWAAPRIPSTTRAGDPRCWSGFGLHPGPVAIGTTGSWNGRTFSIVGGANHAKIGVSAGGPPWLTIFGDLNQQGTLSGSNCASSQNGRGGLFFVIDNQSLHDSVAALIAGGTAPTILRAPARQPRTTARRRRPA